MSVIIPTPEIPWTGELPEGLAWSPDLDFPGSSFDWLRKELEAMAPPPNASVSEYADQHRVLQQGISRKPGPWVTDFAPYTREIMDAYKLPSVRVINVCFGTQMGKTEALYNILLYIIGNDPYSTLLMYPREDDAKTISRSRLQPMIDDCQVLRDKKPTRADLYQLLEMHFPAMILYLTGANSLAALAQKPCRNILRDEIDKYQKSLGKDADPMSKSAERAKSYWDIRKEVNVSSPTFEEVGILRELDKCNVVYTLQLPCPHCQHHQEIDYWTQVKYDDTIAKDDPDRIIKAKHSAYCVCSSCGGVMTDNHRAWMIANYKYVADREIDYDPEIIGFRGASLASPILKWGDFVAEQLAAEVEKEEFGNIEKEMTFINDWLALPFKDTVVASNEKAILDRKCDLPPLIVPRQAVALTAGIDPQKHGFWITVRAWTREMESWLVYYDWLETWGDVFRVVFDTYFEVEGPSTEIKRYMQIWRAGMDIGGGEDSVYGEDWTKTEEIITWIRENGRGVVYAIKGMSKPTGEKIKHRVMDKMPGAKGGIIPGGLSRWDIDTQQMKDIVFWRLSNSDKDPQPAHLHAETDEKFVKQILAEEKERGKNGKMAWVRKKKDNHYLDCTVYDHAAADFQWLGGVKILTTPMYVELPAQVLPKVARRTVRTEGDERSAVKGYQRPSWLRNRRR